MTATAIPNRHFGRICLLPQRMAGAGMRGFAKEIDDLRARIRDIERHLGIHKRIAA